MQRLLHLCRIASVPLAPQLAKRDVRERSACPANLGAKLCQPGQPIGDVRRPPRRSAQRDDERHRERE